MIRSMYSGISGMKNFQTKLDVIGNNIANVNTYGFKKGRVTFKDMVNQTISGASGPSQGKGGVNPKQVGLGAQLAAIDTIDTQGSLQTTGRVLDLAIQGDGYMVVAEGRPGANGSFNPSSTFYTRAGNLYINNDGYLVTGSGHYVLSVDKEDSTLQPIRLNDGDVKAIKNMGISEDGRISFIKGGTSAAADAKTAIEKVMEAVEKVKAAEKAAKEAEEAHKAAVAHTATTTSGTPEYDAAKKEEDIAKSAWDAAKSDVESLRAEAAKLATAGEGTAGTSVQASIKAAESLLKDTTQTSLATQLKAAKDAIADSTKAKQAAADLKTARDSGTPKLTSEELMAVNSIIDSLTALEKTNDLVTKTADWNKSPIPATPTTADIEKLVSEANLAAETAVGSASRADTFIAAQAGLEKDGELYTLKTPIALARFANPGGLQKVGENMYVGSASSGNPAFLAPGAEGAGTLVSGSLEMSNVDLSEEFTEMIVAQRGFQANTRIITTSDEILQELVNLKR